MLNDGAKVRKSLERQLIVSSKIYAVGQRFRSRYINLVFSTFKIHIQNLQTTGKKMQMSGKICN
jgi:hypothetical protein